MQTQLIEMLERHDPFDDLERAHRERALTFIREARACTSRATLEGHVTASAWIVSPDRKSVLLTHHRKLDRWLQLGGHVEGDRAIQQAALREAIEESGIDDIRLVNDALFDIDVHPIPARGAEPAHFHYDFRFLMQAGRPDFVVGDESINLAWVDIAAITIGEEDDSIVRMAIKTIMGPD